MVSIQLGEVECGSFANNTGIFSGQNIQHNWDSHSPVAGVTSFLLGDYNYMAVRYAMSIDVTKELLTTKDNDIKLNHSRLKMR